MRGIVCALKSLQARFGFFAVGLSSASEPSDDELLVLDVEVFFSDVTSSVALESVDFENSTGPLEGRVFLVGFGEFEGVGKAVSDLLLEEVSLDEPSDGFLLGAPVSDSLEDELSEDEDVSAGSVEAPTFGDFVSETEFFLATLASSVERPFFTTTTLALLVEGIFSAKDATDLESNFEPILFLAVLTRPSTVGFGGMALRLSFSSSASLSDVELEEEPDAG